MKILELCNYSAGICGVWQRVKQESELLAKKNEVLVISSNAVKGTSEIASSKEEIQGFKIIRKPFNNLGGESFMSWKFEKEALEYKPDVIISHSYRHLHTTRALKVAKKLRQQGIECKVLLVTHAPFQRDRGFIQNLLVYLYDNFKGRSSLKEFDKIIAITKWEIPYLEKLDVKRNNIVYIPNGIPNIFFTQKKGKESNKIIFLGRISPIKDLETLIKAFSLLKNKSIILELIGPSEQEYKLKLISLIKKLNLESKVVFSPAIYNLKEKISKIDSCKIFVLPSISEGMPQSLIEAMARRKIVISSNNLGGKELIENGKNGFIFEIGNYKQLKEVIEKALLLKDKKIQQNAEKSVEKFKWSIIVQEINKLF